MPLTKAKDLRGLSADELQDKYEALKKEMFDLRIQAGLQKLNNVSKIRDTRKLIAQVLTIKHELEKKDRPNG